MKKLLFVCVLVLLGRSVIAEEDPGYYRSIVMLKQGYFWSQEESLREMFDCSGGKGGYYVEGEYRYNIYRDFYLNVSAAYFGRSGCALVCPTLCCDDDCCEDCCSDNCGKSSFKLKMPMIGLGAKYFWELRDKVDIFVGAGLRCFFLRIDNCSPYVPSCDSKNRVGGAVNAGVLVSPYKNFVMELFFDYLFGKVKCDCSSSCSSIDYGLELGGPVVGLGLGVQF